MFSFLFAQKAEWKHFEFMQPFDLENVDPLRTDSTDPDAVTECEFNEQQKDYLVQQSAIAAFWGVLEAWLLLKPAFKYLVKVMTPFGMAQTCDMFNMLLNFMFGVVGAICGAFAYCFTTCVGSCKCSCFWDGGLYQFRQLERYYAIPMGIARLLLAMEETRKKFCVDGSAKLLNEPVQEMLDPEVAFTDTRIAVTYRFALFAGGNYVTKRLKRCTGICCNPVACIMEVTLLEKTSGLTHVEIQCTWARPFGCFRWFCAKSFFPVKDAMEAFGRTLLMKVCRVQEGGPEAIDKFNDMWNSMELDEKEEIERHQKNLRRNMVAESVINPIARLMAGATVDAIDKGAAMDGIKKIVPIQESMDELQGNMEQLFQMKITDEPFQKNLGEPSQSTRVEMFLPSQVVGGNAEEPPENNVEITEEPSQGNMEEPDMESKSTSS